MAQENNLTSVSDLSDEQLAAALAEMENEEDNTIDEEVELPEDDLETTEPETEDTPDWTPPEQLKIGDEFIPWNEAQDLISKGKSYTQKTQQLAEERKELEPWLQVQSEWNKGAEAQKALIKQFAEHSGFKLVDASTPDTSNPILDAYGKEIDFEDMSENEKHLYAKNQRLQAEMDSRFAALDPLLKEIHGVVSRQVQAEQRDLQATQARESLKLSVGVDASIEDIRKAITETGIQDGEAAWLKVNAKNLAKAVQAKTPEKIVKPNSPGTSGGKTFDPDKRDAQGKFVYSPEQAFKLIQQGYSPIKK